MHHFIHTIEREKKKIFLWPFLLHNMYGVGVSKSLIVLGYICPTTLECSTTSPPTTSAGSGKCCNKTHCKGCLSLASFHVALFLSISEKIVKFLAHYSCYSVLYTAHNNNAIVCMAACIVYGVHRCFVL